MYFLFLFCFIYTDKKLTKNLNIKFCFSKQRISAIVLASCSSVRHQASSVVAHKLLYSRKVKVKIETFALKHNNLTFYSHRLCPSFCHPGCSMCKRHWCSYWFFAKRRQFLWTSGILSKLIFCPVANWFLFILFRLQVLGG